MNDMNGVIIDDNPFFPQPSPSGAVRQQMSDDISHVHGHSPKFGGSIVWNDIQQIAQMNGIIQQINRRRAQYIFNPVEYQSYLLSEDKIYFPGKLPYISGLDSDGYPVQGYNMHNHKNDFDGGAIAGAGNHDHRGVGYGGFAFAVFHPGTSVPLRSYRIE